MVLPIFASTPSQVILLIQGPGIRSFVALQNILPFDFPSSVSFVSNFNFASASVGTLRVISLIFVFEPFSVIQINNQKPCVFSSFVSSTVPYLSNLRVWSELRITEPQTVQKTMAPSRPTNTARPPLLDSILQDGKQAFDPELSEKLRADGHLKFMSLIGRYVEAHQE